MLNENTQNTNQQASTQPEDNGGRTEKMFTQEEVNRIVSDRLARERARNTPQEDEREMSLKAREARIDCIEYMQSLNISDKHKKALIDALDMSNPEQFKKAVDGIIKGFGIERRTVVVGAQVDNPPVNNANSLDSQLRDAFKPNI